MKRFLFACSLPLAFALNSCSNDLEGPLITINVPGMSEIVTIGTTLHVEAELEDLSGITQFKIVVSPAHQDLHDEQFPLYDTLFVSDLSANANSVHEHFEIPEGVLPGPYSVTIFALDENGNQGTSSVNVIFENDLDTRDPVTIISAPADQQQIAGSNISVTANITDFMSDNVTPGTINYIGARLVRSSSSAESYELGHFTSPDFTGTYDTITGDFNKIFPKPSGVAAGDYLLFIDARDIYFNTFTAFVEIEFLP